MTELTALIISIIHILVVFIGNIIFYHIGKKHGYEDSIKASTPRTATSETDNIKSIIVKDRQVYFGQYRIPKITFFETKMRNGGITETTIKTLAPVKFTSEKLTRRK